MIASLGGDVKPLGLSPSSLHINWKGTLKNLQHCSKRVGEVGDGGAGVVVYLNCVPIGLGRRGEIKHELKRLSC